MPLLFVLTDPSLNLFGRIPYGAEIITYGIYAMQSFIIILLLHVFRKGIHDYASADMDVLLSRAQASPEGSGLAAIAMSIITLAYAVVIYAVIGGK